MEESKIQELIDDTLNLAGPAQLQKVGHVIHMLASGEMTSKEWDIFYKATQGTINKAVGDSRQPCPDLWVEGEK